VAADDPTRARLREALVVRHALQPFSPAAFGAAHVGEAADGRGVGDPRRFSYDARWREAADAVPGACAEPPFVAPGLLLAEDGAERIVPLDRLRGTLLRPQAAYLREGLGLRLPEDDALPDSHEPLGSPDALRHYHLREAVFAQWLLERHRPDPVRLQRHLLARAQLPPGADGAAAVDVLLDEVAPFAACALEAGFDNASRRIAVDQTLTTHLLRGTLDGVHDGAAAGDPARLLRVALRAKGRHGNLVLRQGLDWLVASLLRLPVFELYKDAEDAPPSLRQRPLAEPDDAHAALRSLVALHERARIEPLPFLPRSAHEFHAADTEARGWSAASRVWCGDEFNDVAAERSVATALALRARDPFVDGDEGSRARFAWLAHAVFAAVGDATPFALDDMPGSGPGGTP
jgi:exodeoxyribonuclease V gamma subunit